MWSCSWTRSASPEQVEAFATILSGQAGGMPWEALAGTIGSSRGRSRKPIEITVDGQRGPGCRVPGAIELETTPIEDAVPGDEKEVHIVYPKGGFFWNDGNVVTTRDDAGGPRNRCACRGPRKYARRPR